MAAGGPHVCALLDDASVKCWGSALLGQLGTGDKLPRGAEQHELGDGMPVVDLGTGFVPVSVAAGVLTSCAVSSEGLLKCWGQNRDGELGLGDDQNRGDDAGEMGDALPGVDVDTGRRVTSVAAGLEGHTCAILDDATLKCWGRNTFGQLGVGDLTGRGSRRGQMGDKLPTVNLGAGRTVAAVALGAHHTCAILDGGSVKCWGKGDLLGIGEFDNRGDEPDDMDDALPEVDLGMGRTALAINAAGAHTCALLDDDTLKCWDYNNGCLGLGNTDNHGMAPGQMGDSLPAVDLGTDRMAVEFDGGFFYTCALLDDATVKCWGSGQLLGLGIMQDLGDDPGEMGNALPTVPLDF